MQCQSLMWVQQQSYPGGTDCLYGVALSVPNLWCVRGIFEDGGKGMVDGLLCGLKTAFSVGGFLNDGGCVSYASDVRSVAAFCIPPFASVMDSLEFPIVFPVVL
ncbi:hypothetical protein C5167_008020 [Papaver somniferum]|uniref:Uncharacterized protein n=1 Tax=Papaver somniferum TaxID=3469 RepID=A0A4Y7JW89_PAPSO|nr:hypothetical protein C5167_008020 [Papaver somniferum]